MKLKATLAITALAATLAVGTAPSEAAVSSQTLDLSGLRNTQCILPANVPANGCANAAPYRSWVAESVPKAGPLNVKGVTFSFPPNSLQADDSVDITGQTLSVKAGKGFKSLALLGSAFSTGKKVTGTVVVTYTDGSTSKPTFTLAETNGPRKSSDVPNVRAQFIADAYSSVCCSSEGSISIALLPINPKKTVKSITLSSATAAGRWLILAASLTTVDKLPKQGPLFN